MCSAKHIYAEGSKKCFGGENTVSIYTSNKKKFLILFGIWADNDIFGRRCATSHQHLYIIEFYKTNPFSCFIHTFLDYMKYVCKNVIFFA